MLSSVQVESSLKSKTGDTAAVSDPVFARHSSSQLVQEELGQLCNRRLCLLARLRSCWHRINSEQADGGSLKVCPFTDCVNKASSVPY